MTAADLPVEVLLEVEPEPEPEPLLLPPVGVLVIEPVPAEPAWLTTALQLEASLGVTLLAAPEKSQGLVFWVFVAV